MEKTSINNIISSEIIRQGTEECARKKIQLIMDKKEQKKDESIKGFPSSLSVIKKSKNNYIDNLLIYNKSQYGQVAAHFINEWINNVIILLKDSIDGENSLSKGHGQHTIHKLLDGLAVFPSLVRIPSDKTNENLTKESKKSFLVFKKNKYLTIQTDQIAFIYVKNSSSFIMTLQQEEYAISQSLEQIQCLLHVKQFFRLNRQYLVNFNAIVEVEHYFDRKLFVKLIIPSPDKLLIGKERTSQFLRWMEDR